MSELGESKIWQNATRVNHFVLKFVKFSGGLGGHDPGTWIRGLSVVAPYWCPLPPKTLDSPLVFLLWCLWIFIVSQTANPAVLSCHFDPSIQFIKLSGLLPYHITAVARGYGGNVQGGGYVTGESVKAINLIFACYILELGPCPLKY